MEFQIKILLISFVATIVLSIFVIPILKRLKVGQMERDDGPKSHLKKQGTPTMGGVIMMMAITIAAIAGYVYYANKGGEGIDISQKMLPIILGAFGFGLIG